MGLPGTPSTHSRPCGTWEARDLPGRGQSPTLTRRGLTAHGPGFRSWLHRFRPFGAGLAALLSGGFRPSSGRGTVAAPLEGTKVGPWPGHCGSEMARPPVQAQLASWPRPHRHLPTLVSRPIPPSGHPCCVGPSPWATLLALGSQPGFSITMCPCVCKELWGLLTVPAHSSHLHLEKCLRTGPRELRPGPEPSPLPRFLRRGAWPPLAKLSP